MTKEKIAKLEQLSKSDFVKGITCGEFSEGYSRGKQWGEKYLAIEALEIIDISYMEGYVSALEAIKQSMIRAGIKEIVINDETIDFMIEKAKQNKE